MAPDHELTHLTNQPSDLVCRSQVLPRNVVRVCWLSLLHPFPSLFNRRMTPAVRNRPRFILGVRIKFYSTGKRNFRAPMLKQKALDGFCVLGVLLCAVRVLVSSCPSLWIRLAKPCGQRGPRIAPLRTTSTTTRPTTAQFPGQFRAVPPDARTIMLQRTHNSCTSNVDLI
jgi:hypothetical protein